MSDIETPPASGGAALLPSWRPRARSTSAARRRRGTKRSWSFYLSLTWIVVILVVAATVQWLPVHSYVLIAGPPNQNPSFSHSLLGTDNVGRSILARLCYGARISILISLVSTGLAVVIGAVLGLMAVYLKGIVAYVVSIITDTILAIPSLLLLLALVLALKPSIPVIIGAITLTFIPTFTRLARANSLSQMQREYVLAARAMGARGPRLMVREVLPNAIGPLISYAVLVIPSVIVVEGSLSFLGFGVQPPTPTWGSMIAAAQPNLQSAPWQAIAPCLVLFFTVFAVNTLGDVVRARLDISERAVV